MTSKSLISFTKCTVLTALSTVAIYKCCKSIWEVLFGRNIGDSLKYCNIIFFPDEKVACRSQFTKRHGCSSPACKFSHDDSLSYAQLMKAIGSAKASIDICVFCFTASELCSLLCELNNKGVAVRVITDSEQLSSTGSQIGTLRKEGKS